MRFERWTRRGARLAGLWSAGALLAAVVGAAALGSGPAAAAGPGDAFSDWDTDGDGSLSREEFRAGMGAWGVYDLWDTDRDGLLSDEEYRAEPPAHFSAAQAEAWDDAGEAGLDEESFQRRWYDAYDANDDQTLSEAEFGRFTAEVGERQGWPH